MQARRRLRGLLTQLIQDTRTRDAAANGTANGTANGLANGKHDVSIRSGCKPGSFLDLLIHATNKETGKPFTDMEVSFLLFLIPYPYEPHALPGLQQNSIREALAQCCDRRIGASTDLTWWHAPSSQSCALFVMSALVHHRDVFCMLSAQVTPVSYFQRNSLQCAQGRALTTVPCTVQITSQAFTFLLAGYETTANALAFATYLLALNPDKEAKMCEEIDAFGRDSMPGYDDLVKVGLTRIHPCAGQPSKRNAFTWHTPGSSALLSTKRGRPSTGAGMG